MNRLRIFLTCSSFLFSSVPVTQAADWRGTVDENFQTPENWRAQGREENVIVPLAGDRNKMSLVIQNGSNFPLNYTANDGETEFTGQLLIGQNRGADGEMIVSGGVLTLNLDEKWTAVVGQTVAGTLKVTGGILNLRSNRRQVAEGQPSRLGLVLGNEPRGYGVIDVSGGELNVGGGIWLGRRSSSGSVVVSGSGRFVCEGPVHFAGGIHAQKIELGQGSGVFEASLDGELHFPLEDDVNSSYIDFSKGSKGRLSLSGKDQAYFDKLVAEGRIRINGSPAKSSQFTFRKEGNAGVYSLAP